MQFLLEVLEVSTHRRRCQPQSDCCSGDIAFLRNYDKGPQLVQLHGRGSWALRAVAARARCAVKFCRMPRSQETHSICALRLYHHYHQHPCDCEGGDSLWTVQLLGHPTFCTPRRRRGTRPTRSFSASCTTKPTHRMSIETCRMGWMRLSCSMCGVPKPMPRAMCQVRCICPTPR